MADNPVPPRFLSLPFHIGFFPRVLRDQMRLKERKREGFTSTLEMMVTFAVCLILAVIGIPPALAGSSAGWLLTAIGSGGILALIVMSIASQWGRRPTYDDFLTGVFFFFVSLGVFIGVPVGMDSRSARLGALTSLAGLFAGYLTGIFFGLRMQHLGWIAVIVNMLAGGAAIVMVGAMAIMLLFCAVR